MRPLALLPPLAWALLILGLCLLPGEELPEWDWADLLSLDKLVHAGLFAVLLVLGVRALRMHGSGLRLRSWPVALFTGACVSYGGALELMQAHLLTGRTADPFDALANAFGCILGLVYLSRLDNRRTTLPSAG